jgi:hypothetical protein
MRRTNRARNLTRTRAAGATALALAAALLAFPAPAGAASVSGGVGTSTSVGTAGGTCSTIADDSDEAPFTSNGKAITTSSSSSGTVTDSGDMADTSAASASSKVTFVASERDGSLASFSLSAALKVSVNAAQGAASSCAVSPSARAGLESLVTLERSGWITVTIATPSGTGAALQMIAYPSSSGFAVQTVGDETATSSTVWVSAGTYQLVAQTEAVAGIPGSGDPQSINATVKIAATFADAGSAVGAAAGAGGKYVSFAGSRNCADNDLAVTFRGPASKLAKATFYVNGKQKRALANPPAGVSLLLAGLADDQAASVKAVLVPESKGKPGKKGKKPKPITVTRSYRACS